MDLKRSEQGHPVIADTSSSRCERQKMQCETVLTLPPCDACCTVPGPQQHHGSCVCRAEEPA